MTRHDAFDQIIIIVILIAGVLVGIQTYDLPKQTMASLNVVDNVILFVFTTECILKIIAEGRRPWKYFNDHWNKFDFLIVRCEFTHFKMFKKYCLFIIHYTNTDFI